MGAIGYLQSRAEVDPQRMAALAAVGAARKRGTSWRSTTASQRGARSPAYHHVPLLNPSGAQDSEQNLFGQLQFGVDYVHWIIMRAPSPVLLCVAAEDPYFNINGAWETYRHAKRLYTDLGFPERVEIVESSTPHGYHITHREGTARWMSRWLLGKDRVITEPKIALLSEKECCCVPKGNVMSLPGARSVYDLNEDYENELAKRRAASWASGDRAARLAEAAPFDRHPHSGRIANAASGTMRNGGTRRLPH